MTYLHSIKQSFDIIWQKIIPADRCEKSILIILIMYFASIATTFCLIVLPQGRSLGMLGYDTVGHLTYEPMMINFDNIFNWNIRHPLYCFLFFPFIIIKEVLLTCNVDLTWSLFLLTSTIFMSCSCFFIYKILREINLSFSESCLLLYLFCCFAHIIFLSIQVDSFVTSLFFCSLMMLLFTKKIHNHISDSFLLCGITGTTSTNFIKIIIYYILEERSVKKTLTRVLKSIIPFCCFFILTIPNLITRIVDRPRGLLYAVIGDSFSFRGSDASRWNFFIENFLSDPILFHHTSGIIYSYETIQLPEYSSILYYIPIIIIYSLVAFSIILYYHSKIIQMFCFCFGFDIFMHYGIGYGMEEGQLFCGHWLFFIPIVIGMLISNATWYRKPIIVIIYFLSSSLMITNLYHFFQSL